MTDRAVLLAAAAAFAGALNPAPIPLWVAAAALLLGIAVRRPAAVAVALVVCCSMLADRSWSGIEADHSGPVTGRATVLTDPVRRGPATTVLLRVEGTRFLASGYGGVGAQLGRSSAGDPLTIEGVARRYHGSAERQAALHTGHRLTVSTATVDGRAAPLWRVANAVRGRIEAGSEPLSDQRRAIFTGLVYGDDRMQSPLTEVDFRLAGLTHLLAVSGQNVAYTLTVMRPLVQRRSPAGRWCATVAVLVVFATITRFEPSVLRATVMAGLAVSARSLGREAGGLRLLGLAVITLLLVDPLLAETIAFRLSVAASAGILVLGPRLERTIPGPRWAREGLAVTLSAQLAVAPVLTATFGPVSLASIPANVAAGPVAGFAMAWGMTAGLIAGVVPGTRALVHAVTNALVATLEAVATSAAAAPLRSVSMPWIATAVALVVLRSWWRPVAGGRLAAVIVTSALCIALVPGTIRGDHPVGFDSRLVVGSGSMTLVVGDEGSGTTLLEDLLRLGVGSVDVLAAADPQAAAVALVLQRVDAAEVVVTAERPP